MTPRLESIFLPLALLTQGCFYRTTTEVRLADPTQATLRSQGDRKLLPEGKTPVREVAAKGSFPMGPSSTAAYELRAVREATGAVVLEVDSKLPLANGERHVIMDASGYIAGPAALLSPADLQSPELDVPVCARLYMVKTGLTTQLGECSPWTTFRGQQVTPWQNVVEIRRKKEPQRAVPLVMVTLVGGPVPRLAWHRPLGRRRGRQGRADRRGGRRPPRSRLGDLRGDGADPLCARSGRYSLSCRGTMTTTCATTGPGPDRTSLLSSGAVLLGGAVAMSSPLAPAMFARDRIEVLSASPVPR